MNIVAGRKQQPCDCPPGGLSSSTTKIVRVLFTGIQCARRPGMTQLHYGGISEKAWEGWYCLPVRLLGTGLGGSDAGFLAEPDQLGNGLDLELVHDTTPVDLDGFLTDVQLGGNLLI